jgi:fatty-acid desaturase
LIHVALFYAGAVLAGWLAWHDVQAATALGMSVLVWGVLVRQVYVWHVTWGVNSIRHILGYRNYETPDRSRNNWFWGLISMGEGWHNNHHHDPASASNWHRAWEVDGTYLIIRALEVVGLATDVKRPRRIRRRVGEETMRWTQWP